MVQSRAVPGDLEPIGTISTQLVRLRLGYDMEESGAPATVVLQVPES